MADAYLTLNAGSSSLKAALFPATGDLPLARGLADRIGPAGILTLRSADGTLVPTGGDLGSHEGAILALIDAVRRAWPALSLRCVGHRVVHGGTAFDAPVVADLDVIQALERLTPLAPLHQPHNLAGLRAAMRAFPGVPQVLCFDTAFHRRHPWVSDSFALPRHFYEQGIRRYGFHGLSYEHVCGELARTAPQWARGRVVVAHLGNGASMCAIEAGQAVASTMGFSALDGLPMGSRCGQLDPGVVLHLMEQQGMRPGEITDLLYRQSGLLGLSGLSNDMRTLEQSTRPEAAQAIDYFVAHAQRAVGAMAAAMGGIDALVFCGGIGENASRIRARICERLGWMGIEIDPARNAAGEQVISREGSRTAALVVPTNEELVIVRAARAAVAAAAAATA